MTPSDLPFSEIRFPRLFRVRQNLPDRRIRDIPGEIAAQLGRSPLAARLKPGARVGIAAGSRGIANIASIVRAVADFCWTQGTRPFIFPAMGSHGAATAEGQADVLASYGITEAAMGCPVVSSLDVVRLGHTPEGIETWIARDAYESDGVILVNRVKWHTDFDGRLESGLYKMMAIGLGKLAGARHYHTFAYHMGLEEVIRAVGRQVLGSGRILGGLAILEDGRAETARLVAVAAEETEQKEAELLALAKSWMCRIPVPQLDILILNEIGKEISGAGMDAKVVNRGTRGEYNPWPAMPRIERIHVRDLSDTSYGNAVGIGMADTVPDRLLRKIDWDATRVNAMTAMNPAVMRTPMHFPTDRECLAALASAVGKHDSASVTYGWLRHTLDLTTMLLSENLLPEVESGPALKVDSRPVEMEFDDAGNLLEPLW